MKIIKKNTEYKSVYNCKNSTSDYNLVLFLKKNDFGYNRYGFTSAKKIKKAVSRNLIRRRLKEIVRLNEHKFTEGYDIVIMARINSTKADYKSLRSEERSCRERV